MKGALASSPTRSHEWTSLMVGYDSGGIAPELGAQIGSQVQVLRVVTLADGETVHNAFPDRGYHLTTATEETE